MKHYYLSFFIATLMSMAYTIASAHDIAVANSNGKTIYYNYSSDGSSVSVTYQGTSYSSYSNEYTGDVVIPETVTYSGQTYSVTSIGSSAFWGCSGLTSVTIPNSVTSIGEKAFKDCSGLTSVTIPNSVTSIASDVFTDCSGLTNIYVNSSNKNYCSIDGVLFSYDKKTLITYPKGRQGEYTIPDGVTSIGSCAFQYCTGLTSVIIPYGVTRIDVYAFECCHHLASVNIPNSVKYIGRSAFYGCM